MAILNLNTNHKVPIAVATLSKALACGRLFTGIAGSNPERDMDDCLLWVLFKVRGLYVGHITCPGKTLPIVVCLSVISKPQQ